MLKPPRKKGLIGLLASAVTALLLLAAARSDCCFAQTIAGQTDQDSSQKLVEIEFMGRSDAVWIFTIATGDQQIEPGVPFQAGGDWLKDMSILLRNRTDKTIDYVEIALRFPEAGNGRTEPTVIYHIQLGQIPAVDRFNGHGEPLRDDPARKPLGFAPGDSLAIHFGDYIAAIQSAVEQKISFAQITRCFIHRGTIFFDDGTRWTTAGYEAPNPDQPGRYVRLPDDYFPGSQMKFWPPPWTKRSQT
jgi:hypothetical protein